MEQTKALFDIKAEALIAILLEMHPEWNHEAMHIQLKGSFERQLSREVERVQIQKNAFGDVVQATIEIHRKGLYDQLPQGIFFGSKSGEDKVKSARERSETILKARRFFEPFEQAIYQPRLQAAQKEHQWMREIPDFLENFWGLELYRADLSAEQRYHLYNWLPVAHQIVGDWAMTALVFERVIGYPVQIRRIAPLKYELPVNPQPMNEIALGEDSYLGGQYQEDIPALEIRIEVSESALFDFLADGVKQNGRQRRVLENVLYPHFLPFDVPYKTHITLKINSLQKPQLVTDAILGYNAILMS
jgi:hypothetical protein